MEFSQEKLSGTNDLVPQITSIDPDERKLARKLRIERRLEAIRRDFAQETEEEYYVEEKTLLQQQAMKSMRVLRKLLIDSDELITNVRVANDGREIDRREEEGVNKEKIIEKLEEEAAEAKDKFDEITGRWLEILQYNDPLAINEEIANQKEKCDILITQKDSIILMLKDELKKADIKFTNDLNKQKEDINTLAQRIEKQLTIMRLAYRDQLQLQEDAALIERKIIIEANEKRWEDAFRRRRQKEEDDSKKKFDEMNDFVEQMRKLRSDFQEKSDEARNKLEGDIENLQLELENMKAVSALNNEQLDYNYQILKKREDENIIRKNQQKRRINKLQDVINDLRRKIKDFNANSEVENGKLMEQMRKLRLDIMKIEEKADHFMVTNDTKFHQLWDLNKITADEVLEKILRIDRVLYEQQLGLKWERPDVALRSKSDLESYRLALDVIAENEKRSERLLSETSLTPVCSDGAKLLDESPTFRILVRKILRQLTDKAGFFVEDRLMVILRPYTEDDKTLIKLDNVFSALKIRDRNDIAILVDYFLPYAHCPVCSKDQTCKEKEVGGVTHEKVIKPAVKVAASSQSFEGVDVTDLNDIEVAAQQPEKIVSDVIDLIVDVESGDDLSFIGTMPIVENEIEEGEEELGEQSEQMQREESVDSAEISAEDSARQRIFCEKNHPLVINPIYVLRAIREFVTSIFRGRKETTVTSRFENKRDTISRLLSTEDIEAFWDRYLEIFPSTKFATWNCLYQGMQKYYSILKERHKLNQEMATLKEKNVELKQLLESYVAKTAKNPPCRRQDKQNE